MGVPEITRGGIPGLLVTGRYRLAESIGQGGMGRVWRAVDEILDRPVAVKEMRIDGMDQEDARTRRERTLREARATARIDHPNVVRVYDVVDQGERLWIVMELVDGRSLDRVLAEDGPLGPRGTARIGLGLVAALGQVHAGGVLHRDIKPANVLVERRAGRVVLTDFGIAAIQDAEALTMAGMLVGSPDYMAPERVSGRHQGPPSDLWSLGATLCAALGGRSPFSRATTLATLHAVLYEEPEIPSAAGELREVLSALLLKDPSVRPGLEELAAILGPVADGSTGASAPPGTTAGLGTAVGPGQPEPAEPAELTEPARPVGLGEGERTAPGVVAEPGAGAGAGPESGPAPGLVPEPRSRSGSGSGSGSGAGAGSAAGPEPRSGFGAGARSGAVPAAAGQAPSEPHAAAPAPPTEPSPPTEHPTPPFLRIPVLAPPPVTPPTTGEGDPRLTAPVEDAVPVRRTPTLRSATESEEAAGPASGPAPSPASTEGSSPIAPVPAPTPASAPEEPAPEPLPAEPTPTGPTGPTGTGGPTAPATPTGPTPPDPENASSEAPPEGTPEIPSAGAAGTSSLPTSPRSTPMPPGEPLGPPVPADPRRSRTWSRNRKGVVAAAGVLVAGVVAALVIPALGGSPGDKDKASPSSSSSATTDGTPSTPPPTVAGTARPPTLPEGSRTEAGMYAWVPPEGWERVVQSGAEVHYTSPDRKQEILANAAPARGDLMDQWTKTEKETSKGLDYQRIRLEETTFRDAPAVVWEYTVTAKGLPWHARLLGFNADGKYYEITTWYRPDTEDSALPVYEEVKGSFTPL
ncbi:tRNA A-37 threonylcarbamoyl transferase component Bud32 [Streptomyces phaeochromogenes]|nr:serine/threonine-protein kinase [Streptomyces phaeochromogenes]MDQ0952503.1 tRNA A-37 threonylcarbamoyl transferase component Bud32 [Streptomyces phaeochromogenes]